MSSAEGDDPPFLPVGTEVSAKYRGAFCEAKISKVVRSVKYKVVGKSGTGATFVPEERIRGNIRLGGFVEVKNDKSQYIECSIVKIKDLSQYTVVFNDGDIATLRRTALCLKSGRHFAESETLDQLPLTHPEHFSTPVISSSSASNAARRGRRNRMDDESDDEELVTSKTKQSKSKQEKEADIGKVVCVELSDNRKKLSRDNWFPGLIVSPTAQNTAVKIQVKNEYLIRSFKDGRYYTVPKKETQEFTRDIANRVENASLKTAVEKALLFLDKDELPPHWDRELLFGLGDPGSSDSDNGFESDSSDDEPREEKDHFVAQLYKFMDDRGTPINKGPQVNFKDVDLYKLFKVVHKLGGYNRVTNHNQWKLVSLKLGFSQTGATPNHVKSTYKKYLHSFEDFYRKLGCTLLSNPRSNRSRSRSGRSLIRDKDRSTPIQRDKSNEDKDSKDDSSSDRKDEDSDDKERDIDSKLIRDTQSSTKSSIKVKEEKSEKSKEEKGKSESETKVTDEESRKEDKKIRASKNIEEKPAKTSEKFETDSKVSKKDASKLSKDDKDLSDVKEGKTFKTDRDSRMSKKLSALEESVEKKPKSLLGKVLMKRKNPKSAGKGTVKDPLSTLQNTRQKRTLKENLKAFAKKLKFTKSGHQDIAKILEEESDGTLSAGQSQKASDSDTSSKQSTRSKQKDDTVPVSKSRKMSLSLSAGTSGTPSMLEQTSSEKKTSGVTLAQFESGSNSSSSGSVKNKRTEDDAESVSVAAMSSSSQSVSSTSESAKKKIGKKKKEEEKTGTTSARDDLKVAPAFKTVSIGDKLKVYYGPSTQDSKKVTYEAKVLNIKENRNASPDEPSKLYLVHYTGWNTRYDEWIPLSRIADNLTGPADGSENSGTDTAPPKNSNESKGPPPGVSKSTTKLASSTSLSGRNKSPGNSVRPPSSRIMAKKTRTRKISSQNTDGSDSDNDFPDLEDSATRTDDSDDEIDLQNISELSASSLTGSEITTRSLRDKRGKISDLGKDSDNSNDSKKKDTTPRPTKKPILKRKNSDPAMKTGKWNKEEDEEVEETEDWTMESRKKVRSKAEEESTISSSGSLRKKKLSKETSKDEDMDQSADNSSAKKKISTRSNKDSSFDDSSLLDTSDKTPGSSGKKVTRSSVIKRSPRCKSALYVDEIDEDADVEDDDDENEVEVMPKKAESHAAVAPDKKPSPEKDSAKKVSKSKASTNDVKEESIDKKKSKPEEDPAKKESAPTPTENIYQRRYSGRRSTHLKNKLIREAEDKADSKISPKGREYDLAAIRSELKGLSKASQDLESDNLAKDGDDKTPLDDKHNLESTIEDEKYLSSEQISNLLTDTPKKGASSTELLSSLKKSVSSVDSSKKPISDVIQNSIPVIDTTVKKQVSTELGLKKSSESTPKPAVSAETTSQKLELPQKKAITSEAASKKIIPTESGPKKSISPSEAMKKSVVAQETTPRKSGADLSKKKSLDSSTKKVEPVTPNRFAVSEQPSSDLDDIYEFKESDPFEFTECRSKSGSSDEKNPSKLTPRRPIVPGIAAASSSPKVDNLDSRSTLPTPSATPKKKPFSDLSSPPPLVSFSSEAPSVVSVTTSVKRKFDDPSTQDSTKEMKKKRSPFVVTVQSDTLSSEKVTEVSKIDAVKSALFGGLIDSSDKPKTVEDTSKSVTDAAKVESVDMKPAINLEAANTATSLPDLFSRKDKLTSALVSSVIKSEVDKLESNRPTSDNVDQPEKSETKAVVENEKSSSVDSKAYNVIIRPNLKTFSKQSAYKYPPPLVPSKSAFSAISEDKLADNKSPAVPETDSKVTTFDSSRIKLSPVLFSSPAKGSDVESDDIKPFLFETPKTSEKLKESSKGSINGLSEIKSVEVVTEIKEEMPTLSATVKESITKSGISKYDEDSKVKDAARKDYSKRKPVLSKEFINEDSSSSDSSNDFTALITKKASKGPSNRDRSFIFDSSTSSNDDDNNADDDNDDDNNDDEDDDGNLQINLEVSSQEDIKKAIIGEDNIDDDNDADDDDDGDEEDDDEDDDDEDDDDDDDDDDCFVSRKEKRPLSAKNQELRKDEMDGLKDHTAKSNPSKEVDFSDDKTSAKEEKGVKDNVSFDKNEASDENDFIDNELLCEEIIPKSPPPAGAHVDSGPSKLASSKSTSKSKEMPFASALSSNCSYSGADKMYSSSKNLSMFPPKTIKTLQPSSSKFRSSALTNNDRKETSSNAESNEGSKVMLMDITPPMTPENCLSPVSNSPTDDQSNSSPAHTQDDIYKSTTTGHKTVDYNDDSSSVLDIKSGSKKGHDSSAGTSRKRRRSETEGGPSSKIPYSSFDSTRKKVRTNQQSPRACGSDSDDGSEQGTSTLGSSPSNSSITKPSKNNFFVELDPELDGTQRIAILQQKLQDLRKTYMNLKQELACIDRRRKKICRREREGYAYGLRSMNALVRNQD